MILEIKLIFTGPSWPLMKKSSTELLKLFKLAFHKNLFHPDQKLGWISTGKTMKACWIVLSRVQKSVPIFKLQLKYPLDLICLGDQQRSWRPLNQLSNGSVLVLIGVLATVLCQKLQVGVQQLLEPLQISEMYKIYLCITLSSNARMRTVSTELL